ncbi:hypothetical protein [Leifsonia sp. TF02-11]|uniref:hypothetical protein n=1 Tax=Leifsonia sp. TF02-11 TaxID=2815212 RepID=UPI001AA19FA7|nr:hypothetical protein [Leifsonia sp. TF02-11]MBO1741040.1 hypothetical protein [Leifsonia sp. TF02-11]
MPVNLLPNASKPLRRLLAGEKGSIRDSLAAVIVLTVVATLIATTTPAAAGVVTATGSVSERLSAISALVDDKRPSITWGTATSPDLRTVTLPSGTIAKVALWATTQPGGVTYEALTARDRADTTATCTTVVNVADGRCLHASLFRADDVTTLVPAPIIRMDPSLQTPIGSVNPAVQASPLPAATGTVLATATPSAARIWRYLIHAGSVQTSAELRLLQSGKTLATIPISADGANYIGTIAVSAGAPVTLVVSDGAAVTDTILIYDAGAAS